MNATFRYLIFAALVPSALPAAPPAAAQFLPDARHVIETVDGAVAAGTVSLATGGRVILETPYGPLNIPLADIARVDGDPYGAETGAVREHTITLRPDGSALMEYTVTAPPVRGGTVNLLIEGTVVAVGDERGRPLPFAAQSLGGFARCRVLAPSPMLPALRVKALARNQVESRNGSNRFEYRYVPRRDQTFRLRLIFDSPPRNAVPSPAAVAQTTGFIVWEKPLVRQEAVRFGVTFENAP